MTLVFFLFSFFFFLRVFTPTKGGCGSLLSSISINLLIAFGIGELATTNSAIKLKTPLSPLFTHTNIGLQLFCGHLIYLTL